MKIIECLAGKVGFVFCSALVVALTGCTTYVDQPRARGGYYEEQPRPREIYVAPPQEESSYVGIRAESDFYEPLRPYGRWEVVGSYGRCWIPGRVDPDWRPYSNGYWQRTDDGWYWASDEPWGWATYHYGRWDLSPQFGWYWVPQTQWAPAWVSWHQGGGYVGWAPLRPSARFGRSGFVEDDTRVIAPRAYVFVEERRFLEPVRPTTMIVNNTTIINKTVNITKIKVVNNTVINEGPPTQVIEQSSGRKVQAVPVRELRRKQEAEIVATQRITPPASEKKETQAQTPVRSEAEPREKKAQLESEQRAEEQRVIRSQKNAQVESAQRAEDQRAKESQKKAQLESEQRAMESEKKAQVESEQRAQEQRVTGSQKKPQVAQSESKGRAKNAIDDPATSSRVRNALAADPQFKGVNVETSRGVVRLSGIVSTRGQKTMAGKLASKAEGVKDVQNRITVKE